MTTMNFDVFTEKWDSMPKRENSYLGLGDFHPLKLQIGHCNNGHKSLIIMDTGEIEAIPSSFAIHASNPLLLNGKRILEFRLVDNSFDEEFKRLCWDIIESTIESPSPLNDMVARYMSWQRLLQYHTNEIMTQEKQKGLLGELLFFRELANKYSPQYALNAWCGPDGSDQDYLFEKTWTEIKTTTLASGKIRISSLEQLEQEIDGSLVVYIIEKSTPGEQRVSLPDVVTVIRSLLRPDALALDRFNMKLFKYGYRDRDEDSYRKYFYRIIEERSYDVTDIFPKLNRKNVPVEIIACAYELSLPSLEIYRRNK